MPERDEQRLWELQFGVEVSTRYHDWRRSFFAKLVTGVRAIALLGSILSLIAVFAFDREWLEIVIVTASAAVGGFTLIDLVFTFDDLARLHTDLFQRFKRLEAEIARQRVTASDVQIAGWESEAKIIRSEEPPTFWAIYAMCWNQTAERHRVEGAHCRRIDGVRHFFRNFAYFQPKHFPLVA